MIVIVCDDPSRATGLLSSEPEVSSITPDGDTLRIALAHGHSLDGVAAELNRILVTAGIGVYRLESQRASLEQLFLEITTRLDGGA